MKELRDLENLFKTGDLVKVTYFRFINGQHQLVTVCGVFQGFRLFRMIRIFEPAHKEGTDLHISDIREMKSLVFIPN
jgi:hypothetical protein